MAYANGQWPASALAGVLGKELAPAPAEDLAAFAEAFQAAGHGALGLTCGYRPLGESSDAPNPDGLTQWGSWNWYRAHGSPVAATPGYSNHGTGHAADLGSGVNESGTPAHVWAVANGPKYGWSWGAVPSEPWHFEHLSDQVYSKGGAIHPATAELSVDGKLDTPTIARWQTVMKTPVDGTITPTGSALVRAVQTRLNAAGKRDWEGKELVVDGEGIVQTGAKTRTIWALEDYLGIHPDGTLGFPSPTIEALQQRLNKNEF